MSAWLLLVLLGGTLAKRPEHRLAILDGPSGPILSFRGVTVDPATGQVGEPIAPSPYLGKGRVTPVPGTAAGSPMLRYVPAGVVAWDAESGRDLGRVLPVDAREGILTADGAVAVVRTPEGIEGWSTARGERLWRAPDPFPPDNVSPWWRLAGGGVAITTSDGVWLLDPATGRRAWTFTEEGEGARLQGADGDCRMSRAGALEGKCPSFTPTPTPAPPPGEVATDALAALYHEPRTSPRLIELQRQREARREWPAQAGAAPPLETWSLLPDKPTSGLVGLASLLQALDLAVLPTEVTGRAPTLEVNGYTLTLPLRPGRPTLVQRGDGEEWSLCDALWIDPPVHDSGALDRATYELDGVLGADRQGELEPDGEPITVFDADLSHADLYGLGPDEAMVVDGRGVVRWRGAGASRGELACRLVLNAADMSLPQRAVSPRWAYRPPVATPHIQAVDGGVVAWGQTGLVVLDAEGRLRWKREGTSLQVEVRAEQLLVRDRHDAGRVALALEDGSPVAEGPAGPRRERWTAEGEGGRLLAVGDGPLAWHEGNRAVAWAPGRPWEADVAGRGGYGWWDGQIIAWEAP